MINRVVWLRCLLEPTRFVRSLRAALSLAVLLPAMGVGATSEPGNSAATDIPPATALPSVSDRPVLPAVVVAHGARDEKRVALTFDACSTIGLGRYDARIIDTLLAAHTKATLFLGGKWMLEQPERVRELAAVPLFEIGIHVFSHPHLTRLSDERVIAELTRDQQILYCA